MFSYRHAFHAGNHADVLKHVILVALLDYLNRKDKPWAYIDTHAGAGRYALQSDSAIKNAEYRTGITAIINAADPPPLVTRYLEWVRAANPHDSQHALRYYPGSPWLAALAMRAQDRLYLAEWHSSEAPRLHTQMMRHFARANAAPPFQIVREDGFVRLAAWLPPVQRRGLVLIDPAYEDRHDYVRVLHALTTDRLRFTSGMYALWHPLIMRGEAQRLSARLRRIAAPWLHITLQVRSPPKQGFGLYGSGMFLINPPWTFAAQLPPTLTWISRYLGQDASAIWHLAQSDPPSTSE